MVPQDDGVVPNPVADTPVGTPAKSFEEDTDAVVSPSHSDFLLTSIGAKVAAVPFMWAFNTFVGVGCIVAFNTYSDEPKTVLSHVFDVCASAGGAIIVVGSGIALGRVTAPGGQLALLGAGATNISERSYRGLRRSHAWLLVPSAISMMLGLVGFVTATRVGTRSKATGRLITESYAVAMCFGGIVFLQLSLQIFPLWLTLKMSSVLVADAVAETKKKIERCTPASAEWELEVMPSVIGLCTETLPLLSSGWGTGVTAMFIGWWLNATAYFAVFLERGTMLAVCLVVILRRF